MAAVWTKMWQRAGVAYRAKVGKELASHGAPLHLPPVVSLLWCGWQQECVTD